MDELKPFRGTIKKWYAEAEAILKAELVRKETSDKLLSMPVEEIGVFKSPSAITSNYRSLECRNQAN